MLLPTIFDMRKAAMPSYQQSASVFSSAPALHPYLPSPPPVRRSVDVSILLAQFLLLEEMRLALLRQTDALHARRHQPDKYTKLHVPPPSVMLLLRQNGRALGFGLWAHRYACAHGHGHGYGGCHGCMSSQSCDEAYRYLLKSSMPWEMRKASFDHAITRSCRRWG
jgi:hypothetical protein